MPVRVTVYDHGTMMLVKNPKIEEKVVGDVVHISVSAKGYQSKEKEVPVGTQHTDVYLLKVLAS